MAKKVEFEGKLMTFAELSKRFGIDAHTIRYRYNQGIRGEKLVSDPVPNKIFVEVEGERLSLDQISKKYHLPLTTVASRHYRGLRGAELIRSGRKKRDPEHDMLVVNGKAISMAQVISIYGKSIGVDNLNYRYYSQGLRDDRVVQPIKTVGTIGFKGREATFQEIADVYQLPVETLRTRYFNGGDRDDDLVRPIRQVGHRKVIQFKGHDTDYYELGYKYGIKPSTIRNRYRSGDRDDALVRPVDQRTHGKRIKTKFVGKREASD